MEMKYALIFTLTALVALVHEGQSLECFACSTHKEENNKTVVDITNCASDAEIGGPVKGAKVITCNRTAGENACYKLYTYAYSAQSKEQTVTKFERGCIATEEPMGCTHNDGYTAKTDFCFCSGSKCNGAQGLNTGSISLFAGLLSSIMLLLTRN